jgi:hypothetical protein
MGYGTGTVNSATPCADAYNAATVGLAALLTAAGFTLVDTQTISTRTHKVWKSPGGSNSFGTDWYLDVAYTTTGSGAIYLAAIEFYDPATHVATRGPFGDTGTTIDATTFSRFGAGTAALETSWVPSPVSSGTNGIPINSGVATGFWFQVSLDAVMGFTTQDATRWTYAGLYDMTTNYASKAGAGAFPLISLTAGISSTIINCPFYQHGLTRIPPFTSMAGDAWGYLGHLDTLSGATNDWPALPSGSTTGMDFTASKISIKTDQASSPKRVIFGTLKNVWIVPASGITRGDTCKVAGVDSVLSAALGGYAVAIKAT